MKNTTLGHHWVPLILKRLGAMATLPSTGILAGQAVASAILAELGKGPVVYNDIDVFLTADDEKEKELATQAHLESEALRLGIPAAELDAYRQLTLNSDKSLDILGSTQEGLMNFVWCKKPEAHFGGKKTEAGLSGSHVIFSFDLNAVEVAIDLSTNVLYWSRAFEYFLKTHELQVTSLTTPERTLMRYFKKRDELQAYGNDSLVVDMTARWIAVMVSDGARKPQEGLLTKKFLALAKKYETRYRSALHLDEGVQKLECVKSWEERTPDKIDVVLEQAMEDDELMALARLMPRQVYGNALARSKELETAFDSDFADRCPPRKDDYYNRTVVAQSLTWLRHEYLADHRTTKHYDAVTRLLTEHPGLCGAMVGLSLDEQYQCLQDIKKRAKAEGDYVYGIVESDAIPADMWNQSHRDAFFKRIEREESQAQLAAPVLPERDVEGIRIRELVTTRELRIEGAQMDHCVGGYSSRIASGRSRILSLRIGGNPKKWSTAEISLKEDSKLIVVKQHYSKGNSQVTKDNRTALAGYLQEEAQRMGFKVQDSAAAFREADWYAPF